MRSIISAIGTASPSYRFPQSDILKFMISSHRLNERDALRLKKLYDVSGIEYRNSVIPDFDGVEKESSFFFKNGAGMFASTEERSTAYENKACEVVIKAVNNLFEKTPAIKLPAITHLITVSCTGMYAPGLDIDLVEKLGLNYSTQRTCINFMGCYGAFNALKIADYICRSQPEAKVLIADVELCTLHFQNQNTLDNWIANSLFADGAAAVLVESESDRSSPKGFLLESFYNVLVTDARNEMGWRIGNTGYQMKLTSHIAKNIRGKIHEVSDKLLSMAKIPLQNISRFAIHPGGRRILEVCEEALNLPEELLEDSYDILRQFGNMSSATILFVLQQMLAKTEEKEKVMSFAFGPGLTFESMILQTV